MMLVSIYGRLGKEPRIVETANLPMCVSSVAVELLDRNGDNTTQWFGLVAFGKVANTLAKHSKGELIAASGRVQTNSWNDKGGQTKTELQLIADSIIGAHARSPGDERKSGLPGKPDTELLDANNDEVPLDDQTTI